MNFNRKDMRDKMINTGNEVKQATADVSSSLCVLGRWSDVLRCDVVMNDVVMGNVVSGCYRRLIDIQNDIRSI